jgi:hypothetical protein
VPEKTTEKMTVTVQILSWGLVCLRHGLLNSGCDTNGEVMGNKKSGGSKCESNGGIRCFECEHFRYFQNDKGHNSPSALGECLVKSWDGNRGQWPMLQHPCSSVSIAEKKQILRVQEA